MSTRKRSNRVRDSEDIDSGLSTHITVEEKEKRMIEEYPEDIVDQLKRAAFSEADAANTYVKHLRPTNDTANSKVVTVEVSDKGLVIEAEDIVGIVNLTPNATLQIDPKIGWSEILEMFLSVNERRRALEYRGIPIRDFLADDIGLDDVFVVVALNYLDSLDAIFRHGFMRSFKRRRTKGLQGRGRIDMKESLKNFDVPNGIPKHEFVQKVVEYSIPVNDIIYNAGIELERLFHLYSNSDSTESYTHIFSRLERALNRLNQRGITGESVSMGNVSEISQHDIPRQRHYYDDALQISKSILSSTIGQPLDEGREELLMEYIIGMETLFEEYVALSLDEELAKLQKIPIFTGLDDITIEKKSYQLFEDEKLTYSSQPDHVILDQDNAPVAVLDSKYYAKDSNPIESGWARSRLLSYGFQLQTDCLGVIAPLANPTVYEFKNRPGIINIIAPDGSEFNTEELRDAVNNFLHETIGEENDLPAIPDIEQFTICHPNASASSLEEALNLSVLHGDAISNDARVILKYITTDGRLSDEVSRGRGTPWLDPLSKFSQYLSENVEKYDIAVPVFIGGDSPKAKQIREEKADKEDDETYDNSSEFIKFHCFNLDGGGMPIDYNEIDPFVLSW